MQLTGKNVQLKLLNLTTGNKHFKNKLITLQYNAEIKRNINQIKRIFKFIYEQVFINRKFSYRPRTPADPFYCTLALNM